MSGFFEGFFSVFRALRFLVRTKRTWPFAAFPAAVMVALAFIGLFLAVRFVAPVLVAFLPHPEAAVLRFLVWLSRGLVFIAVGLGGAFAAASCAPVIAGPALEHIVLLREKELGLPEHEPVSFFRQIVEGLRAQLLALAVAAPVVAILWIATLAFPPIAVVTVPLKLATGLALVVWGVFDCPLSMRGVPPRERLTLLRRQAPAVVGFGAGIAVLFAIPLGAIVLLPVAVAAATELGARN